jgi:hypothetical protein
MMAIPVDTKQLLIIVKIDKRVALVRLWVLVAVHFMR